MMYVYPGTIWHQLSEICSKLALDANYEPGGDLRHYKPSDLSVKVSVSSFQLYGPLHLT